MFSTYDFEMFFWYRLLMVVESAQSNHAKIMMTTRCRQKENAERPKSEHNLQT